MALAEIDQCTVRSAIQPITVVTYLITNINLLNALLRQPKAEQQLNVK